MRVIWLYTLNIYPLIVKSDAKHVQFDGGDYTPLITDHTYQLLWLHANTHRASIDNYSYFK